MRIDREVHAEASGVAVVEHRPLVGAFKGKAHDAVLYTVVIAVELDVEDVVLVGYPHIQLLRVFRLEITVAHERIVEVVESRHTEDTLVECARLPSANGV